MQYKLKPNVPDIEIADGPFAGRKFVAGEIYKEIPTGEEKKFEPVPQAQEEQPGKIDKRRSESGKQEVTDA